MYVVKVFAQRTRSDEPSNSQAAFRSWQAQESLLTTLR